MLLYDGPCLRSCCCLFTRLPRRHHLPLPLLRRRRPQLRWAPRPRNPPAPRLPRRHRRLPPRRRHRPLLTWTWVLLASWPCASGRLRHHDLRGPLRHRHLRRHRRRHMCHSPGRPPRRCSWQRWFRRMRHATRGLQGEREGQVGLRLRVGCLPG